MRRRGSSGFTMVELLMVVAIITVATVVAWPTLSTFMGQSGDVGAATAASRYFNRVRDQARRRNRAYLVRFGAFSAAQPTGTMTVIEGTTPSCRTLLGAPGDGQQLEIMPFGQTPQGNYQGHVEKKVGFRGWQRPGDAAVNSADLDVCITPDGAATWRSAAGVPQPIAGSLKVQVQRFLMQGGAWAIEGPPRHIEISFAGGSRLGVK
ncbi:MAG: type II secretion system protein [Myxococcales bacterium]|nr:type II secretion system protein [Myxococcales bacterium]MCB9521917.1 type II secretion system protein [Myxococcales bacterium]